MKTKKIFSLLLLPFITFINVYAQTISSTPINDSIPSFKKEKNHKLIIGIGSNISSSSLTTSNFSDLNKWAQESNLTVIPSVNIQFFLTNNLGVGSGVKLGSYSSGFKVDKFNFRAKNLFKDIDNDNYHPVFEGIDLIETNVYKSVDIPIQIIFQGSSKKTNFYASAGTLLSMFYNFSYNLDGSLTRKGYYPLYKVQLDNYPEYNYDKLIFQKSNSLELDKPSLGISAFAEIGIVYAIQRNLNLKLGVATVFGLNDINPVANESFNGYHSSLFLENVKLRSTSFEIGILYMLSNF
jgi:hypothetical protein